MGSVRKSVVRRKDPENGNLAFSRRRFIATCASATAGLVLGVAGGDVRSSSPLGLRSTLFPQPHELHSRDGVLDAALRATDATVPIRGSNGVRPEHTRCYNGLVPGPTLRVHPGDELRIRLVNRLGPNTDSYCRQDRVNGPHCFNTTNIHTHGLHVSPKAPSDDPYLAIEPGGEYQYVIRLPESHPAGTFWYHPHHHGSTALQVMNGMAGALIVDEPAGQKPLPKAKDIIWLVQEIAGRDADKLYTCHPPRPSYTVNGAFQPTLSVQPGEVQRWRFVNATATPGGFFRLQLLDEKDAPQPLVLVALDGHSLRDVQEVTEYTIPPGGRADFLVQIQRGGRYQLKKWRVQGHAEDQTLAWIDVRGPRRKMSWDDHRPAPSPSMKDIADDEIKNRRTVRFQMCPDQARGGVCSHFPDAKSCNVPSPDDSIRGAFLIDGKPYDPNRIDHHVTLGTAEEWEVINETGSEHPFHIHVNDFQVVRPNTPPESWLWRDTVTLPVDGSVKIRLRFADFTGRSVLHCHILVHSDMGMMQNFEVA